MNDNISFTLALSAGFVSFFSPCILPLIPAYITYITGASVEEELKGKRLFTLIRTLGFTLGFTIIFMIMGISASFLGQMFIKYRNILMKVAGALIIIFGLTMSGVFNLKFFKSPIKLKAPGKTGGWFSAMLVGMAFATGWTPCVGAVLGSILVYASMSTTISKGVYLLLFYSLGLAVPFIITALLINSFSKFLMKFDKTLPYISKISGVIMVIFGIYMII